MTKLKMWNEHPSWAEAEKIWDEGAKKASGEQPLKGISRLPNMQGITEDTARHLKWKAFKWMIAKDEKWTVLRQFFKHPIRYGWGLLKASLQKETYKRDDDFFLYGVKTIDEFATLLKTDNSLFVIGFSYCHKPFECPSGRFTDKCIHQPENPVCRQCFIGKCVNALPENNAIPLFIPTIHYIGGKILNIVHDNPGKQIFFIITACELALEMFGDLGNMVNIKGLGVRLGGRICNTMKAFELSEKGIKPGLTVVLDHTQQRILALIRQRREG